MPMRPKKPCAQPGCPELVDRGRCEKHRRQTFREQDRWRGSRHERGYGTEWDRLRVWILERDKYLCQMPGCWSDATDVDHIIPKADGGTDEPSNLRALCRRCHIERHRQDRRVG